MPPAGQRSRAHPGGEGHAPRRAPRRREDLIEPLAELRALRCGDPAGARANEAVRLTANTLEFFWLRELGAGDDPT